LIALADLTKKGKWSEATKSSKGVTKGIMNFLAEVHDKKYAANTRETIRKDVLHQFEQARIINKNPDDPTLPTTSPKTHYALTDEVLQVLKSFGTLLYNSEVKQFLANQGSLKKKYAKSKKQHLVPVKIGNKNYSFSPGKHNQVQKAILEEFAPRFAKGSEVLYIGDTAKKNLFLDEKKLKNLNIPITVDSKLPDVVIYDRKRNWLFLIEAVTSRGPFDPKRIIEIEELLEHCTAGIIYVTAFPDFKEFKKHSKNIAWETEVWIVESPDHMIHFNGDRFMGPR